MRLQVAYTASKGAVLAATRELAVVHARENIRFNSLCPGPLRTELLMKVGRWGVCAYNTLTPS